ncbi:MAG: WecB/TagA/CpsF family glycosyltransferase [Acidobacteria bacterium]|nr:WecB/TagA/CpsF family glycosyltransferase [Acidobacteriota bacterium]
MTVRNEKQAAQAPQKQNVLGVGISATSYEEATAVCGSWVEQRRAAVKQGLEVPGRYVAVTSVHGIVNAVSQPDIQAILNGADMATPDGMPVVWALRSFGHKAQQRVYGPTLMLHVCAQAARFGHRIFLYGGRTETLPVLVQNLKARFPGIQIVDSYSPPFRPLTPEEDADCIRRIREADADIVFVGISTPKQERWMADHKAKLPGVVMFGVGAAFDFHAGRVEQAPGWMQRSGLEWFFRLTREPKRLWRRYVLETPRFLPLWAMQWAGLRTFSMDGSRGK